MTAQRSSVSLFREQSLRYRMARPPERPVLLLGNELPGWLSWTLLVLFGALLAVLMTAEYRSTASARGVIVAGDSGQRIFAPETANIHDIHVQEGDRVEPGQVLVTLLTGAHDHRGRPAGEREMENLAVQRDLTRSELEVMRRQATQRRQHLQERLRSENSQRQLLEATLATLSQRTRLLSSELESLAALLADGAIARIEYSRQQREQLAYRQQEQQAMREGLLQDARIAELRQSIAVEELDWEAARLRIDRRLKEIELQQQQLESKGLTTLVADISGTVTTIALERGERVRASQTVLFLNRSEAELQALVYAPSRVADRSQSGQQVMIRLDAYDYRHHGRLQGEVVSVAQTPLDPREYQLPVSGGGEPMFPIVIALPENGDPTLDSIRLRPGAAFTADFIFETRSLIEFIFEPIFRLRGKVV